MNNGVASTSWPQRILGPVTTIAIAQLLATSLWFSANSAADSLMLNWSLTAADIGWLTSAVQAGFIVGTLIIAFSGLAERYRASSIFVISAVVGAIFNASFVFFSEGLLSGVVFRFLVGLALAGVYPMGMKLIVKWAPAHTGLAMGLLVAMLTLGSALPHGLRALGAELPWQVVIFASSGLALLGAWLIFGLGEERSQGSNKTRTKPKLTFSAHTVFSLFKIRRFRAAAWGYFGHMWELYAFWTILPLVVSKTPLVSHFPLVGVAGLSFLFISMGAIGCILGGIFSRYFGSTVIALVALSTSGMCALIFILFWQDISPISLALILSVWGMSVIADSPQFSTMSAKACPQDLVGTALTIQNAIGFTITIISISATTTLFDLIGLDAIWLLVPGPVLGLLGFTVVSRSRRILYQPK